MLATRLLSKIFATLDGVFFSLSKEYQFTISGYLTEFLVSLLRL
jgi:hypothetical protein